MPRKRRSDRTHIIYQLTNTVTSETYIGITVAVGRAFQKSVKDRLRRHIVRATNENHDWTLCNNIRQHGAQSFTWEIKEFIRGKAAAHKREVELIKELRPALNTASNKNI
jgi:uncharacterized protein YjaG (DUF416 family)